MRFNIALVVALLLLISLLTNNAYAESNSKRAAAETDSRGLTVVEKNRDGRKRVALVIGNSSYKSSPLKNPANDAKAMAAALRRLGFEVEEKTDLGYIAMNMVFEKFGKRLKTGGVSLFYYAGHGVQVNGTNYLLPIDVEIENENEVRYKAVDTGLVLAKMEQAKSDVNLVVLDACRNNPFARSFRSSSKGLASMDAPSGSLIAYATAPGKTAADGSGKNGLYTEELIRMIETPGLSVEEAFKRTRKVVMARSGNAQVPWESSSLTGDFRFVQHGSMTETQPSSIRQQNNETLPSSFSAKTVSFTDSSTGIELVDVPGGCFQMGCGSWSSDCSNDEKPVHEVCVSDFSISKFVVTQGLWKQVMGNNPSYFKQCGDDCPVENVSWNDIQEFINKLNSQSYSRFRLPTEAEWEYSCRSGGKNEKYCGGDDLNTLAWHSANSIGKTHPVGQKQPNSLGLYDMSGNVWQWVSDWFDSSYYSKSQRDNPSGPSTAFYRVFRGGGWNSDHRFSRASFRNWNEPGGRSSYLGFRLVLITTK